MRIILFWTIYISNGFGYRSNCRKFPSHSYADFWKIFFQKNPNKLPISSVIAADTKFRHNIKPRMRDIDVRNLVHITSEENFWVICIRFWDVEKLKNGFVIWKKNFQLEQIEQDRDVFLDSVRRKSRILNHQFILDLRLVSTIDLRSWQRRTSLIFEERNRTQIFLSKHIALLQTHIHILWQKVHCKIWYVRVQPTRTTRFKANKIPKSKAMKKSIGQHIMKKSKGHSKPISFSSKIRAVSSCHLSGIRVQSPHQQLTSTLKISRHPIFNFNLIDSSLEQEVHSQIQTMVEPLHQKYTIFLGNSKRLPKYNQKMWWHIASKYWKIPKSSFGNTRWFGRIDTGLSLTNRHMYSKLIPVISGNFKNPAHSQLYIETSTIWQKFISIVQRELQSFGVISPVVLPEYKQLIQ